MKNEKTPPAEAVLVLPLRPADQLDRLQNAIDRLGRLLPGCSVDQGDEILIALADIKIVALSLEEDFGGDEVVEGAASEEEADPVGEVETPGFDWNALAERAKESWHLLKVRKLAANVHLGDEGFIHPEEQALQTAMGAALCVLYNPAVIGYVEATLRSDPSPFVLADVIRGILERVHQAVRAEGLSVTPTITMTVAKSLLRDLTGPLRENNDAHPESGQILGLVEEAFQ